MRIILTFIIALFIVAQINDSSAMTKKNPQPESATKTRKNPKPESATKTKKNSQAESTTKTKKISQAESSSKIRTILKPDESILIKSHNNRKVPYTTSHKPRIWLFKTSEQRLGYKYHVLCERNFHVGKLSSSGHCQDNKLIFQYGANRRVMCGTHEEAFKITIKTKYMLRILFIRGNKTTGNYGFRCRVSYDSKFACPRMYAIMNGRARHTGKIEVGSKAIFSCNNGYKLVGNDEVSCTGDGSWNITRIPSCQRMTCSQVTKMEHGKTIQNQLSAPGDVATLECDDGYELVGGAKELKCGSDGKWSHEYTNTYCKSKCQKGQVLIDGNCFWFTSSKSNWNDCLATCYSNNGTLASVTSKKVEKLALDQAKTNGWSYTAIGLKRKNKLTFKWIADGSLVKNTDWTPDNSPKAAKKKNCGGINHSNSDKWFNSECQSFEFDSCLCQK